jgi:Uma2 family endonuclease
MKKKVTAEEFARMTDDESALTELDEGVVVTEPFLSWRAGRYSCVVCVALAAHAESRGLGEVYAANTGFRLGPYTVRAPSTSFVRESRVTRSAGFLRGGPDLAVEFIEGDREVRQLMRKVKQYFAAGTHTVWIVYPDRKEVQILEATGADRLLQGADPIEAPELLPGFSVSITEFFE